MIRHSVIIPQHDRADEVRRQLPSLTAALDHFGQPYEIIIVDDGSSELALHLLKNLRSEFPTVRLLRFDQSVGLSVALSAGIHAARGEMLIAIEPGEAYQPYQIATLIGGLQRADFMAGRRRQTGVAKLWHRINRLPRWLLLGLDGHDPDCLFWAARREAFADLHSPPAPPDICLLSLPAAIIVSAKCMSITTALAVRCKTSVPTPSTCWPPGGIAAVGAIPLPTN